MIKTRITFFSIDPSVPDLVLRDSYLFSLDSGLKLHTFSSRQALQVCGSVGISVRCGSAFQDMPGDACGAVHRATHTELTACVGWLEVLARLSCMSLGETSGGVFMLFNKSRWLLVDNPLLKKSRGF